MKTKYKKKINDKIIPNYFYISKLNLFSSNLNSSNHTTEDRSDWFPARVGMCGTKRSLNLKSPISHFSLYLWTYKD